MQDEVQNKLDAAQADLDRIRRSLADVKPNGGDGSLPGGSEPQLEDIKIGMTPEARDAVLRKLRQVLANQ
jgi:hypothetical protein